MTQSCICGHSEQYTLARQGPFSQSLSHFLRKHPRGYYVATLRVTGSTVETFFGQFKYSSGEKLDAANYSVARAAFLMKQATEGHHSGVRYRDAPLYVHNIELKKSYKKNELLDLVFICT